MYDVVVTGGGPAGSVSSYILAREGFRVLMLEKGKYPRRKPCGGGVSRRSESLLRDLGLFSEDFVSHRVEESVMVFHRAGKRFVIGAGGVLVHREVFDHYLAGRAENAGAEVRDGVRVLDVHVKNGVVKIYSSSGVFEARAAIIASGQPDRLASSLGARPVFKKAVAYEFDAPVAEGIDPSYTYFYMNLEPNMMGYFWVFPKGRDVANYGVGTWSWTAKEMVRRHGSIGSWISSIMGKLGIDLPGLHEYLKRLEGHIVPVYWGSRPADLVGDRSIAVGDAAGLVDFKGEGICSAIASAKVSAKALSTLLEEGELSKKRIVDAVSEMLRREVLDELRVTPIFEMSLRRFPETISRLMEHDKTAREVIGRLIEHSIDGREAFRILVPKLLRYFGSAVREYLRQGIL